VLLSSLRIINLGTICLGRVLRWSNHALWLWLCLEIVLLNSLPVFFCLGFIFGNICWPPKALIRSQSLTESGLFLQNRWPNSFDSSAAATLPLLLLALLLSSLYVAAACTSVHCLTIQGCWPICLLLWAASCCWCYCWALSSSCLLQVGLHLKTQAPVAPYSIWHPKCADIDQAQHTHGPCFSMLVLSAGSRVLQRVEQCFPL